MTESNPLSDSTPGGASFRCAPLIKEIGRGARGARALSHDDAYALYTAMLDGRVSDVELGAVVLAYRVKGETPQELAAMLAAAQASLRPLATRGDHYRPVSIPSYNGARKQPNLTPLLALLLARRGVPVLVHGVTVDPGRVTSAEIFAELDLPAARSIDEIDPALAHARVAFAPIDVLAPKMSRLLGLRATLGVRNTTHTLVKLLQPFAEPGLRLVNLPIRLTVTACQRCSAISRRQQPVVCCWRVEPKEKPRPIPGAGCRSIGCMIRYARRWSMLNVHRRKHPWSNCPTLWMRQRPRDG
ncbi:Glycosyl transferase family, helical bundle domain [Burkholderia sp. b13]|nr:Glycosyl transferase family, helical bundle domain [Burkholderia sp. b13]